MFSEVRRSIDALLTKWEGLADGNDTASWTLQHARGKAAVVLGALDELESALREDPPADSSHDDVLRCMALDARAKAAVDEYWQYLIGALAPRLGFGEGDLGDLRRAHASFLKANHGRNWRSN